VPREAKEVEQRSKNLVMDISRKKYIMNSIEKMPCANPNRVNIVSETPIYNEKEKKCLRCLKNVKSYSFNTY
jgi:hypothetical protein